MFDLIQVSFMGVELYLANKSIAKAISGLV